MKTRQDERDAYTYAVAVMGILEDEAVFTDGLVARDAVMMAVAKHRFRAGDRLEVIVDDPFTANWRLRPDRDRPGYVLLASFHMSVERHEAEVPRMDRVNAKLRGLR